MTVSAWYVFWAFLGGGCAGILLMALMFVSTALMVSVLFSAIVTERRGELGLLKAIGARRSQVEHNALDLGTEDWMRPWPTGRPRSSPSPRSGLVCWTPRPLIVDRPWVTNTWRTTSGWVRT